MMADHTPGPWEAGHECISGTVAVWAGDAMVAQAGSRRLTAEQSRTDARLIAAAPELLEAAAYAQTAILLARGKFESGGPIANVMDRALDGINTAIAKASPSQTGDEE